VGSGQLRVSVRVSNVECSAAFRGDVQLSLTSDFVPSPSLRAGSDGAPRDDVLHTFH
jgi:hypothetical protein